MTSLDRRAEAACKPRAVLLRVARLLLVPPRDLHHLKTRGVLVKPRVAVLVKPRAAVLVKYGAPCDCFWLPRRTFITCEGPVSDLDKGLCRAGAFSLSHSLSLSRARDSLIRVHKSITIPKCLSLSFSLSRLPYERFTAPLRFQTGQISAVRGS